MWDLHSFYPDDTEQSKQAEVEFLRERVRLLERHLREKDHNISELLMALGIKKEKIDLMPRYPVLYGPDSKL